MTPEVSALQEHGGRSVPIGFRRYAIALIAVVAASVAVAQPATDWASVVSDPRFWVLAAFTLAGELLPVHVPRRNGHDWVTISTAFGVATLLSFGPAPAMAVYAAASAIADLGYRTRLPVVAFNATQYVASTGLAALALSVAGAAAPLAMQQPTLPPVLLAILVFFAANQVLSGTGIALLQRDPVRGYLKEDLPFQTLTSGFVLALAPIVALAVQTGIVFAPLCFVPMVAIYLGGREAAVNGHRATHDLLTDLPNRALLRDRIEGALDVARRSGGTATTLILDLDDFKAVNDTLGHHSGDALLVQLAARLRRELDEGDTLARLGGDEFAVLLRDGGPEQGVAVARRLLRALEQPFSIDSLALDVRASVGVASFPSDALDPDELLRHADVALYHAKASHQAVECYREEDDDYTLDRLALAGQLRRGIERGELKVFFQPKVPLRGEGGAGVEALVRWQHPQLGLIGPDGFIGLAEQSGLIKPLTDRVLRAALEQCRDWRAAGLEVRMAVNLCSRSLLDSDLPASIARALHESTVPAASLQLEITETSIVSDLRRARGVLEQLRAMGVTIAIDDFGTGFSSLTQLQQLPVDEIKIDRSFVHSMRTNVNDAAIVRSTVHLGRDLGLRVTAEGVESQLVLQALADLGCDFAQGFHVGRPTGADECARALRTALAGPRLGERRFTPSTVTPLIARPAASA
jgi:diguanylate cyclase (GGDEF)-like protein